MTKIRQFSTGANRDTSEGKYEYWGFLSSLALRTYAEYMHKHRRLPNGELRESNNWKKGMPFDVLIHSLSRHTQNVHELWEEGKAYDQAGHSVEWKDALCGVIFNAFALLHNIGKPK